jgi:hypothetical protein
MHWAGLKCYTEKDEHGGGTFVLKALRQFPSRTRIFIHVDGLINFKKLLDIEKTNYRLALKWNI